MAKEPNWLPEEMKVIDRHLGALGRGRSDALASAKACLPELRRVWRSRKRPVRRPLNAVHQRVLSRAKALGLVWPKQRLGPEEKRLVERYAQTFIQGAYPSVRQAASACRAELSKRVRAGRSWHTVYQALFKRARQLGLTRVNRTPDWREDKVLDRYVRVLHEGRYKYVRMAAPECLAELERLRCRRPDADMVRPRTLSWVMLTLYKRSAALGLPRYRNLLTPLERGLLERFARKVDQGELPDWLTAARACLAEIQRRYARPTRLRRGGPRRLTSHSIHTVHTQMLDLAHRLNLRGPRCIRWSAPENKLLHEWLGWYSRYRPVRRLEPMRQASEGLQEDLAEIGYHRTRSACECRLREYFNRQQGVG